MKKTGWLIFTLLFTGIASAAVPDNTAPINAAAPITKQSNAPIVTAATGDVTPIDIAQLQSGQKELRVGHYNQLPPFYFGDNDSQRGLGYDTFSQVAKNAGIQKVRFIGFDSNIDLNMQLKEGKIDVIANSWDLPGMRKQFLLSTPYYTKGGLSFLYFKQKGSFQTVDDLKNATIGVFKQGYADRYWLPAHGIAKTSIRAFPTIKELMFALKDGDIDVAVVYYPLAQLAQQQLSGQLAITLIQPINDVYAMRKQDTALQIVLNQAIQNLTVDGTLNQIQAQYLNPPSTATAPAQS